MLDGCEITETKEIGACEVLRAQELTHTHTHLLRNIFANSDVEGIIRVKNTSIKPDRIGWMTRSEKLCEVNRSTSLLDEPNRSDSARSSSNDIGK